MWSLIMGSGYSSEEEMEDQNMKKSSSNAFNQEVKVVPPQQIPNIHSGNFPSPGREQGDGMEKPTAAISQPAELKPREILENFTQDKQLIELPETGLKLDKLPPISDTVDLPPVIPKNPLVAQKPKLYPRGSFSSSGKRMKEPKFVPYEPYRGAVAFMETNVKKSDKKISRANRSTSVESEVLGARLDNSLEIMAEPISKELENNYRAMLDAKEIEIQKLRENLDVAEKQLKIQSKVNTEVKKLLVASVGEDIEARVDFLTQDKARLAADVIDYNNRIATDWEKKEALGVESDVWRSKFLASTVIVEELTRTKQTIQQRAEDLEHLGRRLLLERTQLRSSLSSTQLTIDKLSQAFDPLNPVRADPGQLDTLKTAEHLLKSSQALCARLVGQNKLELSDLPTLHAVDSPAEAELKKLLSRPMIVTGKVPDEACSVLAKDARLHLLKLGDLSEAPHQHGHDQFKTCSHCSGSVQDV
eukprot:GFUD01053543.1.p1 GENE.GFUD01053543.1~~GFUD01053543.1.p1  ORF type:complete len:474 (+),score=124.90 GFUD01053543.1:61-1482(+)